MKLVTFSDTKHVQHLGKHPDRYLFWFKLLFLLICLMPIAFKNTVRFQFDRHVLLFLVNAQLTIVLRLMTINVLKSHSWITASIPNFKKVTMQWYDSWVHASIKTELITYSYHLSTRVRWLNDFVNMYVARFSQGTLALLSSCKLKLSRAGRYLTVGFIKVGQTVKGLIAYYETRVICLRSDKIVLKIIFTNKECYRSVQIASASARLLPSRGVSKGWCCEDAF